MFNLLTISLITLRNIVLWDADKFCITSMRHWLYTTFVMFIILYWTIYLWPRLLAFGTYICLTYPDRPLLLVEIKPPSKFHWDLGREAAILQVIWCLDNIGPTNVFADWLLYAISAIGKMVGMLCLQGSEWQLVWSACNGHYCKKFLEISQPRTLLEWQYYIRHFLGSSWGDCPDNWQLCQLLGLWQTMY